jgi:hypothetical protein
VSVFFLNGTTINYPLLNKQIEMLKNKILLFLPFLMFIVLGSLKSQDAVKDLRKANQLLSIAQERDRISSEELEDVKSRRLRKEEDLIDVQDNPQSMSKEDRKKLENDIVTLRKHEEVLIYKRKYANNLLVDVTNVLQASPKKRAKFISEYEKRIGVIDVQDEPTNTQTTEKTTLTVSNEPKIETATDLVVKPEPKKKAEKPKKETPKKPKKEALPVVVQTETAQKQPDVPSTEEQKDAAKTMVETLTEPVSEPTPEPVKAKPAKVKKPKTPMPSVRVPSESVAEKSEPKKKKEEALNKIKPNAESSKTAVNYKKYEVKDDVMQITPSNTNCNLAFDGMDNFTGKKKQETTPITLFAHTDDFMRATMKNKDYVTCEVAATRVEGSRVVYLNLTITVQTKDAQRTFGFLDRGALVIFRFINGKKMSLATNKTDIGIVDPDKGTTTFRAQLTISETVEFTASELDAIRVSWSIGYEDYEIFDMDVLRNLFKCLDKK